MVRVDGYNFEITVVTPDGDGEVVGWGGDEHYESIPLGEVVVELYNKEITSYKPNDINISETIVELG